MNWLTFIIALPFLTYFVMIFILAVFGEFVVVNKNGLEEWLVIMAVFFLIRILMMGVNRFDRSLKSLLRIVKKDAKIT